MDLFKWIKVLANKRRQRLENELAHVKTAIARLEAENIERQHRLTITAKLWLEQGSSKYVRQARAHVRRILRNKATLRQHRRSESRLTMQLGRLR